MSGFVRVGDAGRGTFEYAMVAVDELPVCECIPPRTVKRVALEYMGNSTGG